MDVENNYLCVFFIRTDIEKEIDVTQLAETLRPDILDFYLKESGNYSNFIAIGILYVFSIMF